MPNMSQNVPCLLNNNVIVSNLIGCPWKEVLVDEHLLKDVLLVHDGSCRHTVLRIEGNKDQDQDQDHDHDRHKE